MFAPQLQGDVDRIADLAYVLVEKQVAKTDRLSLWLSRYNLLRGSLALATLLPLLHHKKVTRRQVLKPLHQAVEYFGLAWLLNFHLPSFGTPLGLFEDTSKKFGVSLQWINDMHFTDRQLADAMFRDTIAHELVHFFGDGGLGILPRDALLADAYSTTRMLEVYGEETVLKVYRTMQVASERKDSLALAREAFYHEGANAFEQYPTDPDRRDEILRRRVMRNFPDFRYDPDLKTDGMASWEYLYATATAASLHRWVQRQGGDFRLAYNYLYLRSHGATPAEAERQAFQGVQQSPLTLEVLEKRLEPTVYPLLRMGAAVMAAELAGSLAAFETVEIAEHIRRAPVPSTHRRSIYWAGRAAALSLIFSYFVSHTWQWTFQQMFWIGLGAFVVAEILITLRSAVGDITGHQPHESSILEGLRDSIRRPPSRPRSRSPRRRRAAQTYSLFFIGSLGLSSGHHPNPGATPSIHALPSAA